MIPFCFHTPFPFYPTLLPIRTHLRIMVSFPSIHATSSQMSDQPVGSNGICLLMKAKE